MVLLVAVLAPVSFAEGADDLVVTVKKLRSDDGMVRGLLWTAEEGFPDDPEKSVGQAEAKPSANEATLVFSGVEPGKYAVSVVHDEDDNEQLDTNFLGIPTEGVGISNGAIGMTGPGEFEDAKIDVGPDAKPVVVDLRYW